MNIKELLKELGLKEKDLAEFFGLKPKDYYSSSARKRYEESFIRIYSFLRGEKEKKILNDIVDALRNVETRIANINDDRFTELTEAIDLIDDAIDKIQECDGETSKKPRVLPISGVINCTTCKHRNLSKHAQVCYNCNKFSNHKR